jgi:hypothetical protein
MGALQWCSALRLSGETGIRNRLKICRPSLGMWVRPPPQPPKSVLLITFRSVPAKARRRDPSSTRLTECRYRVPLDIYRLAVTINVSLPSLPWSLDFYGEAQPPVFCHRRLGYERFKGDTRDSVLAAADKAQCFGCHLTKKEKDFVFSEWKDSLCESTMGLSQQPALEEASCTRFCRNPTPPHSAANKWLSNPPVRYLWAAEP